MSSAGSSSDSRATRRASFSGTPLPTSPASVASCCARLAADHRDRCCRQLFDAGAQLAHGVFDVQVAAALAQQPVAGVPQQPAGADRTCRTARPRPRGCRAPRCRPTARASRRFRARWCRRARSRPDRLPSLPARASRTPAPCDSRGCWWSRWRRFRAAGDAADFARITLAHRRREIALHLAREIGIVGQVGSEQVIAEPDLAVREHHRELGPREPEAAACAARGTLRRRAGTRWRDSACRCARARESGSGIR